MKYLWKSQKKLSDVHSTQKLDKIIVVPEQWLGTTVLAWLKIISKSLIFKISSFKQHAPLSVGHFYLFNILGGPNAYFGFE